MKTKIIILAAALTLGLGTWNFGLGTLFAQNIGINTTGATPNASALLDIDASPGNNKGLLIPRLTTADRNAIASPAHSLLIYNTTTDCFEAWNNTTSTWVAFGCLGCQLPGAFSATAATNIAATSFDANWNASAGATTYYLDVATDAGFTAFVTGYNNLNVGNVVTYSVNTNLTCATTYYYRIRASNNCGTSANSNTITVTSGSCFIVATGGTITTDGNFKVHIFNSSGTFEITSGAGDVEYLVIAGGGGGNNNGGGGAGGYRTGTQINMIVGSYTVTVGAGGAVGANGLNSVFDIITSIGGGAGGNTPGLNGAGGGSGGGARGDFGSGSGVGGAGTGGQGNNGGDGYQLNPAGAGGGGGGATSAGVTPTSYVGGAGGNGTSSSITGTPVTRAGGGGGGGWTGGGVGGAGGGGTGAGGAAGDGTAGTANTGGGGGAAWGGFPAAGGSGVVIVRYQFQ